MVDEGGVWRTISGRKVFIKDGESVSDAMKRSGKFKNNNYLSKKQFEKELKASNDPIKDKKDSDKIGETLSKELERVGKGDNDYDDYSQMYNDLDEKGKEKVSKLIKKLNENNSPVSENNLNYSDMEKGSKEALKSFINRSPTYENMILKHGQTLNKTLDVMKDDLRRWYSNPYPDEPNIRFEASPKDYDKVVNQYSRYLKYQIRSFISERETWNKNGNTGKWTDYDIKKFKVKNKDIFK